MIIQNLYKKRILTLIESKKSPLLPLAFFTFFLCFNAKIVYAQDSIPPSQGIEDKKNIDFQEHFFSAITNKAINNYQKAIESLEKCNQLEPNNKAVLFELSKNYYKIGRFVEAIEYGNSALLLEPDNLWIAEHLVQAYKSSYAFDKAIKTQKNIAKKYPKKKQNLVFLYLQSSNVDSAKIVLNELENAKLLTPRLRQLQTNLYKPKKILKENAETTTKPTDVNIEEQFKKEKSFFSLKQLLTKLDIDNDTKLLSYSEEGLALFPAQPLVYLMNAKAYNKTKNYKKAIVSLQNGIDFVIDDPIMQANFYNEFVISYKGLGDVKNTHKYQKKLKE